MKKQKTEVMIEEMNNGDYKIVNEKGKTLAKDFRSYKAAEYYATYDMEWKVVSTFYR